MSRRRHVECPTPSKRIYDDVEQAREATRHSFESGHETDAVYAYRCVCGKWHRSSHPRTRDGAPRFGTVLLLGKVEAATARAVYDRRMATYWGDA